MEAVKNTLKEASKKEQDREWDKYRIQNSGNKAIQTDDNTWYGTGAWDPETEDGSNLYGMDFGHSRGLGGEYRYSFEVPEPDEEGELTGTDDDDYIDRDYILPGTRDPHFGIGEFNIMDHKTGGEYSPDELSDYRLHKVAGSLERKLKRDQIRQMYRKYGLHNGKKSHAAKDYVGYGVIDNYNSAPGDYSDASREGMIDEAVRRSLKKFLR